MYRAAMGDTMTGVHGFGGVAMALYRRERTGLGDWIQVSLLDTYLHSHEINIQEYSGSRGAIEPGPAGSNPPPVAPGGFYLCGDRWVLIACVADEDWRRLSAAIGRPELGTDPRYASNTLRVEHHVELQRLVADWVTSVGDPRAVMARLDELGVCAEIVYSVAEAVHHPHNVTRRGVRTVPDDVWGEITIPGVPIRVASVPEEPDLRAHELGADTRTVLRDLLGKDDLAVDDLVAAGVVHEHTGDPTAVVRG
jgi:crotonobetainyl-CoA:carnitine CoA-transferase CaiB-like acyl-CoA transferase